MTDSFKELIFEKYI